MTRILLLFGLVALTSSQLIFPDQYEMMKNSTTGPYAYTSSAVRASGSLPSYSIQTASNSQPAQGASEFADTARPAQTPSVAQAAPVGPPASLQSEQTNWNQHVCYC